MKKMIFIRLFSFITFFCINVLFAQTQQDVVIPENEPFGDPNWNFRGRMNGNRVSETFENHGEIGYWNENRGGLDYSDWPKGSGHPYLHGVGVVVGAQEPGGR